MPEVYSRIFFPFNSQRVAFSGNLSVYTHIIFLCSHSYEAYLKSAKIDSIENDLLIFKKQNKTGNTEQ